MSEAAISRTTLLDAPGTARLDLRLPPRRSLAAFRRFATPVLLVCVWQASASLGVIPSRLVASPVEILDTFWTLAASGELLDNLLVSLGRVTVGLAIGVAAGTACALVAGLSRLGEDAVDAPLQMARTLPHLAMVPLFILWFGIGETPKLALVALGAMFPIYLNLFAGIRGVDPKLVEAANTLGLSRAELIRHVILPGALPSALVGLRYALGVAWLSLVVGEQINAQSGIGYMMMDAREFLRTDIIMVGLLVYALLGLGADQLVRMLERRALAWRPAFVAGRH
jgi:sulfonate transport system permease protein